MNTSDLALEQTARLRRLAWQEAKRAQRTANRLTLLTTQLDLLLRELRSERAEDASNTRPA